MPPLRRSALVALAVMSLAGSTVTSALGSTNFGAPVDLSAPGGDAEFNQVAIAPDGTTTVTWTRNDGANPVVQAATRPAGSSAFGAPVDVSAAGGTAREPRIAIAADGTTTIVWVRQSAGAWTAQAATRPAGSSTFGAPVNLSTPSGSAYEPDIAVAPDGTTTAMWVRSDGANYIVQAATRPAGSGTFGSPVDVSAAGYDADRLNLAVGPDGTATAAWFLEVSGDRIIQTSTRAAGSGTFSAPVDLTSAGGTADHPVVAFSPDGTTTIAWERRGGGNFIVQAATRPTGSGAFGATIDVSATGQDAERPAIGIDATGATTITWIRSNGVNYVVQVATRPAGSGTFGATADLSAPGEESRGPTIAVTPDGQATVSWYRYDGSAYRVQAATRPAGATGFDSAVNLSAAGGSAYEPAVASDQYGATTIAWYRNNGSYYGVQAASAAGSAPPASVRLTVERTGAGTVTSTPSGIACGSTCAANFTRNASVTLTAEAEPGSSFSGWGGGCAGSARTCTVALAVATTVTATFTTAPGAPGGGTAGGGTSPGATGTFRVLAASPRVLALTSWVRVPGPGVITQRARSTGARAITACHGTRRVASSTTATMRCALTPAAVQRLRHGSMRVRLATTFTPAVGAAQTTTRMVTLPARMIAPPVTG